MTSVANLTNNVSDNTTTTTATASSAAATTTIKSGSHIPTTSTFSSSSSSPSTKMVSLDGNINYIPISQFYAGRSVFITGGTGFMGKVILKKKIINFWKVFNFCFPSIKSLNFPKNKLLSNAIIYKILKRI